MPLKLTRHILPLLMTTAYAITGHAQTDSMHISLQQLFDLGTENSLQLSADRLKEQMAYERTQTAHMAKRTEQSKPSADTGLATELCHRLHTTFISGRTNKIQCPQGKH
jgi:hypothetical protein